jgi:hypothetical protein
MGQKKQKKNLPEVIQPKQIELAEGAGPMTQVTMFIAAGGKFSDVREMMQLQREYDAYEAKKAYVKAMALFKKDPPKIYKDKSVGFKSKKPGASSTSYKHATLGAVTDAINKGLGECGFSVSFPLEQDDNSMKVTCIITHELGHSESTSLKAGFDNTGNKNTIQSMGSTISYLERYTVLALTGLATHDQDDDGQAAEPLQFITENECIMIKETIESIDDFSEKDFLSWAKIDSVEGLLAENLQKIKVALKARSEK